MDPDVTPKPTFKLSLQEAVMRDFCMRIKDQPQGTPTTSPQSKKMNFMHLALDKLLRATFDEEFYSRYDYFFKKDAVYVFQSKQRKHHVIYSTRSENYYLLFNGSYRFIKFGLLDDPPASLGPLPLPQKPDIPQEGQGQVE